MPTHNKPNRLINEKPPYLLQRAHNPVDWFPWREEAFEKAKRENKPVLVSIGYSTCSFHKKRINLEFLYQDDPLTLLVISPQTFIYNQGY